jgi:hypothetical protein
MRKIKTSELTGAALDWAVANLEWEPQRLFLYGEPKPHIRVANQVDLEHCYQYSIAYSPSTGWAQGGSIIEREKLVISPWGPNQWRAQSYWNESFRVFVHVPMFEMVGSTPLSAAMHCFVASKLGDEVEIPEELL